MPATLEAPEKAQQESEQTEFQKVLAAANAKVAGEPEPAAELEPEPAAAEASPSPPAAAAPVQGVSPEWKAIAESRGVPPQLIAAALSNDQLQQFIALCDTPTDEPAPVAKEATKPTWLPAGEEFDPTDPAHVALKAQGEYITALEAKFEEKFGKLTAATGNLVQQRQMEEQQAKERDFDAGLDSLNLPELGASKSVERRQVYPVFEAMLSAMPHVPRPELAKRAALATFSDLVTKQATAAQLAALKAQQADTLGGGTAKPAPKHEPTSKEKFLAVLREKSRIAREAGY